MAKRKEETKKNQEEKLDHVFRIFAKTNAMKRIVVIRIELPNNEVHEQNYGLMPNFEVVMPYIGEHLEYYLDNKLVGMRVLDKADRQLIKLEELK